MKASATSSVSMVKMRRRERGKATLERRIWIETRINRRFEGAHEGVCLSIMERS